MSGRIAGKVALLSGCGGAKGLDVASLLASEGAIVYISDLEEGRAANLPSRFLRAIAAILGYRLCEAADWAAAVARIAAAEGNLDILVFNGRVHSTGLVADLSLADRSTTSVILDGVYLELRSVAVYGCIRWRQHRQHRIDVWCQTN